MRWGGGGGGGGGGGVEIKMPLCGCTDALAAIAVWSPFVKTAAPMTKTSASTCAPFVALTEKFFGKLFSTGKLVSFCLFCMVLLPLFVLPAENLNRQTPLYHKKPPISKFFVIFSIPVIPARPFPRHSRPCPFPVILAPKARESNIIA